MSVTEPVALCSFMDLPKKPHLPLRKQQPRAVALQARQDAVAADCYGYRAIKPISKHLQAALAVC